ncbi:polysaccharide pyruvyl transferase family protein [Arcticibacter eurypsychrophilus]|uniref:polysaccharide pyruvyl transferase family protein n=1 Tax=Arcticibacter eurypsychrophilus TaxID=1434752 RepID=UPI00084DE81F|nr:polysaccharide pyruvyl transferase family protein [Arcticibacter eurypsychrophilus]
MKIGIMTFWESQNNYGQLLQAFALKTYLRQKGHDVFFIRFYRIPSAKKKSALSRLKFKVILYLNDHFDLNLEVTKAGSPEPDRGFTPFKKQYLKFSPRSYTSLAELKDNPPQADAYICGSDQVWNNTFKVPAEPFFLPFGKSSIKRIAYAASIGQRELSPETAQLFERQLSHFNAVSVREKSSLSICTDAGYKNPVWVPDPTLLFAKQDWLNLLPVPRGNFRPESKKVFIYTLGNSAIKDKEAYLSYIRDMPGVEVQHASANGDTSGNRFPSIPEWLGLIAESDFIMTNSFHGMVFCIIFNKKFIILPNTGAKEGMNERITSLITKFNLEQHMMFGFDRTKMDDLMKLDTDWDYVNNQIADWRHVAHEFLDGALK